MRGLVLIVAVVGLMAACTVKDSPPPTPPPPPTEPPPTAPPEQPFAQPPADAGAPVAADAAAAHRPPPSATACSASATECCLKDGTVVKPGGCQPSYPSGVQPATRRGPDGYCVRIPCYLKCLPERARIATPRGDVPVSRLRVGDVVWTTNAAGGRVAAAIVRTSRARVLASHHVVELVLSDGRVARASPGHPAANGVPFGQLRPGDLVDGARVVSARRRRYRRSHTRDILPAGTTGQYWVDGVLVRSTLSAP